ncbi:hypothetical protein AB4305_03410 [Nocardia sp. 2YAB30]|uniref:hypothetical protein n=1 Tax=unclassified Nocardia TaxID=2637762 RepID=UPI003F987FB3
MRDDDVDDRLRKAMLFTAANEYGYSCHDAGADDVLVSGPDGEATISLTHLRRLTAPEPLDQWFGLISDHMSTVIATLAVERQSPVDVTDFLPVRALIRTRVYPDSGDEDNLVCRAIAPGLVQRLLIDRVHTVAPVQRSWIEHWPTTEAELFRLAEDNVRADGGVDVDTMPLDGVPMAQGLAITRLIGPEYLTAHIRWLDTYPVVGPAGALVIVPSKRVMFCYPITDLDVLRAAAVLARLGQMVHADEPWPVSPWLYRWHNGSLDLAARTISTDDGVGIFPSEAFEDLINTLGTPPGPGPGNGA